AMLITAIALVGCGGATMAPTNVTRVTATLHGKASCAGGPCWWFFRYGTNNLYQYRTPAHETATDTHGQELELPGQPVSDLTPGTTYQYQLCGLGDTVRQFTCVGPDGTPQTSEQFRTPDSKADCLYPSNNVLTLAGFGQRVGYRFRCAMIFANQTAQWAGWEVPWFTTAAHPPAEYLNWQDWKNCNNPYDPCTGGETRQII